jgi:hypothetical protein
MEIHEHFLQTTTNSMEHSGDFKSRWLRKDIVHELVLRGFFFAASGVIALRFSYRSLVFLSLWFTLLLSHHILVLLTKKSSFVRESLSKAFVFFACSMPKMYIRLPVLDKYRFSDIQDLCFGVLIPLASIFGSGTLLVVAVFYIALQSNLYIGRCLSWCSPYLALLAAWTLFDIVSMYDQQVYGYLFLQHPEQKLLTLRSYFKQVPLFELFLLESFLRMVLLAAFIGFFEKEERKKKSIAIGMVVGLAISLVLTTLQINGFCSSLFVNQNSFWTGIHRLTGTYTDPNAFGVFIAFAVPLLYIYLTTESAVYNKKLFSIFVLLWGIIAQFSGSRTYFLGLFLHFCFFLLLYKRRLFIKLSAYITLIGIVLFFTDFFGITFHPSLPQSLKRTLETLSYSTFRESISSRLIFIKATLYLIMKAPIFGVGFGQYRLELPFILRELGIDLNGWSDNANNLYLGILAELGIVGIFILSLSIRQLSLRFSYLNRRYQPFLWSFLGVFSIGPHIDFDEVAMLFAFIVSFFSQNAYRNLRGNSELFTDKEKSLYSTSYSLKFIKSSLFDSPLSKSALFIKIALLFSVATIFCIQFFQKERGFYPIEYNQGKLFRWTKREGAGWIHCERGFGDLFFTVPVPELERKPATVSFNTIFEKKEYKVYATNNHLFEVKLECQGLRDIYYMFTVSRIWSPSDYGLQRDRRILGIMQHIPEKALLLR